MPDRGPLISWLYCMLMVLSAAPVQAITIDVQPYCEVAGGCGAGDFFFDHPEALVALEFAVKAYEPLSDSLSAISAGPGWTATFTNPETGASGATASNLLIPANTLKLFAGGYDMPGNQVAEAGPGTANISLSRGQGTITGAAAFDFATWGGSIAFDTLNNGSPRNWHFGVDTLPGPGQVDFLTIAFHELGHVFGFGSASSFDNIITANQFQGAAVIGLTGTTQALAADNNHWASGTTSPPYANEPPAALTASLLLGRRTPFTPLDYAALKDLGWQVPDKLLGLHGDADGDGDVDGRDFLVWQRGYGATGQLAADMSGDLMVDEFDLWLWRGNHGKSVTTASLTASIRVPEPSTVLLSIVTPLLAVELSRRVTPRRRSVSPAALIRHFSA